MKRISQSNDTKTKTSTYGRVFAIAILTLSLTGCYVDVHEHGAYNDMEVTYSADLTDFETRFLVDAALIPFSLASESPYMVIDPEAYTSPRVRNLTRANVIETTYAYLFDDWSCDHGGHTEAEAEADTTSYDNGYTFVDIQMNASASYCGVDAPQGNSFGSLTHYVNSDLNYNVTGWYDDWENQISSLDSNLSGSVSIDFEEYSISHSNVDITTYALSSNDFVMRGTSHLWISDAYDVEAPSLSTTSAVHWYLGDTYPHQGTVRVQTGFDWVDLSFEEAGVWRTDINGNDYFYSWSELGFR